MRYWRQRKIVWYFIVIELDPYESGKLSWPAEELIIELVNLVDSFGKKGVLIEYLHYTSIKIFDDWINTRESCLFSTFISIFISIFIFLLSILSFQLSRIFNHLCNSKTSLFLRFISFLLLIKWFSKSLFEIIKSWFYCFTYIFDRQTR